MACHLKDFFLKKKEANDSKETVPISGKKKKTIN